MKYELAKQLKDAGFPMLETCEVGPDCPQWWYFPGKEALHAPSLSELIEATLTADSMIFSLLKQSSWHRYETGFVWSVTHGNPAQMKELSHKSISEAMTVVYGNTPEEAVANLWLLLNSRSTFNNITPEMTSSHGVLTQEKWDEATKE